MIPNLSMLSVFPALADTEEEREYWRGYQQGKMTGNLGEPVNTVMLDMVRSQYPKVRQFGLGYIDGIANRDVEPPAKWAKFVPKKKASR